MSSDETYYELPDRYHESNRYNRPRRRGSSQSGRHKHRKHDYFPYKNRRTKVCHTRNTPRLVAGFMLIFLVIYEIIVLKGPLVDEGTNAVRSARVKKASVVRTRILDSEPLDPISAPEGQSRYSASSRSQIPIGKPLLPAAPVAAKPHNFIEFDNSKTADVRLSQKSRESASSYHPLKEVSKSRSISTETISTKLPSQKTFIGNHLDSKPADADDNPSDELLTKPARQKTAHRFSKKQKGIEVQPVDSEDIEPPKPKVKVKMSKPQHAADPGAGENFWQWFQDNKGTEKGAGKESLSCPEDYKRLCQMYYKYLRKYKIRCVYDASCSTNLDWVAGVLQKAGSELWGFKYYCSAPSSEDSAAVQEVLGSMKFVEVVSDIWWKTGFPEDTELLFGWDILPHIAYGRVWNFFVNAKKQGIKYILIDNYPGILNDPFVQSPDRNYLNVRKHPFRFPSAKEVVQNVTEPGETAKRQLLFYESDMLPNNLQ